MRAGNPDFVVGRIIFQPLAMERGKGVRIIDH